MYKILSIDYGIKRTGIAITDSNRIIASGLKGIMTKDILYYIDKILSIENIKIIVIGLPLDLKNKICFIEIHIQKFIFKLKKKYPYINIERIDERYTSKLASKAISNYPYKKKRNKNLLNIVSAIIILQSFLKKNKK